MTDIIKENITEDVSLKEAKDKDYYIEGIFLQCDVKNRNGRYYPLNVVKEAVDTYKSQYINTGRSLGELGHPDGAGINLHLASHKIVSLEQRGNDFIGKAKILDTPMGNIAKSLIKEGVKLGVSLRGLGSITEKNGVNYVDEGFVLSTVDIVADPSAPDAFVNGIMESSQKYLQNGMLLQEDFDEITSYVKSVKRNTITEQELLGLFEDFCNKLTTKN